ncbi:MAG: diacylglycerol kinase family protein [Burkholderiaceae bacterium]
MHADTTLVTVLLNPHAGGGRAAALEAPLRQWLAQNAGSIPLQTRDTAAQARQLIDTLPHGSRIVVVGGDGTFNQLLPSVLAGHHTAALVPFGSGNDTARALGVYGLPWQAALQHGLTASASRVDVGWAEFVLEGDMNSVCRIPFISSLTTGFDSSVGLRAINGPTWLRGLPRYLLATLRELANLRTWDVQVKLDGQWAHTGDALFASTLNTRSFGGGMPAVPQARIDDGQLNLLLAKHLGRLETLLLLPRLLVGKHLGHPKVNTQTFKQMQVDSATLIPVAADGEYLGQTRHVTLTVQADALSVVRRAT